MEMYIPAGRGTGVELGMLGGRGVRSATLPVEVHGPVFLQWLNCLTLVCFLSLVVSGASLLASEQAPADSYGDGRTGSSYRSDYPKGTGDGSDRSQKESSGDAYLVCVCVCVCVWERM